MIPSASTRAKRALNPSIHINIYIYIYIYIYVYIYIYIHGLIVPEVTFRGLRLWIGIGARAGPFSRPIRGVSKVFTRPSWAGPFWLLRRCRLPRDAWLNSDPSKEPFRHPYFVLQLGGGGSGLAVATSRNPGAGRSFVLFWRFV